MDEAAAQLAIESCRNNELIAIKRLLEDAWYKSTVIGMSKGEIAMDLNAIMYSDRNQELRDLLAQDAAEEHDSDNTDNWEMAVRVRDSNDFDDFSFDDASLTRKRSSHSEGHSDRKLPRLCLDDALIMLANLETKQSSAARRAEEPQAETKEVKEVKEAKKASRAGKKGKRAKEDDEYEADLESSSEFEEASSPAKHGSKARSTLSKEKDLFKALSGSAARKVPVEALRQLGWSEARIKAFRNREKNPNQYYYRFNDPGEPQATGKWSAKDKALFLKLVEEKGVDYQWGIFSMNIPGRVGYQCSNFYRQLIKDGEIKDSNYHVDKDGKLVFRFHDRNGRSTLRHSRRRGNVLSEDELSEIEIPVEEEVNVLPDYIDPMTMMPVEKPTISPYGHVMGYDSWIKVLNRNPKNTCPFTKKKLTRRSLVKLTPDNIDEYRDKIINANGFDIDFHCE